VENELRVLVTVKAYPGLGRNDGEAVCVAGVRLDTPSPQWIRLWPVGFRELPDSVKFSKWQIIELDASKSRRDQRPESYTPQLHTLKLEEKIDSSGKWRKRRALLGGLLGETTLCDLVRAQENTGPSPSLGLVKVRPGASAQIVDGPVWEPAKEMLADFAAAPHLFRSTSLQPLRPPKFQVSYRWNCAHESCPGHVHSSCDWEVGAAALNFSKKYPDVTVPLIEKFGSAMLAPEKDTYFFVGNQHQRPKTFMVLGAFYPSLK